MRKLMSMWIAAAMALALPLQAELLFEDDFESYTVGEQLPEDPAGWDEVDNAPRDWGRTIEVIEANSPFGEAGDTQSMEWYDNADNRFVSASKTVTPQITDKPLNISFDMYLPPEFANYSGEFRLLVDTSDNVPAGGLFLALCNTNLEFGYVDTTNTMTVLGTLSQDVWYHVDVELPAIGETARRLTDATMTLSQYNTETGVGEPIDTYTIETRQPTANFDRFGFGSTGPAHTGNFVIDNFLAETIEPFVLGDFDGNGAVNGLDIPGFKDALADPQGWADANPDQPHPDQLGDFDGNGAFNGLDIPGFKDTLAGTAVPEPTTTILVALGALALVRRRR